MLMLKTIMSQIRVRDWFVTVSLKDAHFHIQVIRRHRKFLRFAFGGKTCQYKVLPFGLALAPMTFKKCMDAALAPLRLQDICVLNYLDDWLILAHSRESVSCHRDVVHQEECSLPFPTNFVFGSSLGFRSDAGPSGSCPDFQPQYMFGPLQARPSFFREHLSQALRPHGHSLPCAASGVTPHEAIPLVDEAFMVPLHRTSDSLLCFRTLLI